MKEKIIKILKKFDFPDPGYLAIEIINNPERFKHGPIAMLSSAYQTSLEASRTSKSDPKYSKKLYHKAGEWLSTAEKALDGELKSGYSIKNIAEEICNNVND